MSSEFNSLTTLSSLSCSWSFQQFRLSSGEASGGRLRSRHKQKHSLKNLFHYIKRPVLHPLACVIRAMLVSFCGQIIQGKFKEEDTAPDILCQRYGLIRTGVAKRWKIASAMSEFFSGNLNSGSFWEFSKNQKQFTKINMIFLLFVNKQLVPWYLAMNLFLSKAD